MPGKAQTQLWTDIVLFVSEKNVLYRIWGGEIAPFQFTKNTENQIFVWIRNSARPHLFTEQDKGRMDNKIFFNGTIVLAVLVWGPDSRV